MNISSAQVDGLDLSHVEYFELGGSQKLLNLNFLQRMPQLHHLNISFCCETRYHLLDLRYATKLRVLKICGLVPDEVCPISSVTKNQKKCILSASLFIF